MTTHNEQYDITPLIILFLTVIAVVLIIILFNSCSTANYIDSDPFYGADTIYQQQNNKCYTIKT